MAFPPEPILGRLQFGLNINELLRSSEDVQYQICADDAVMTTWSHKDCRGYEQASDWSLTEKLQTFSVLELDQNRLQAF